MIWLLRHFQDDAMRLTLLFGSMHPFRSIRQRCWSHHFEPMKKLVITDALSQMLNASVTFQPFLPG
ncbi:hypothetical protein Xcaj_22275 [Xanthomonas axonopodis pv. cajani]|uniref:Transposase n=1 Tax=Xanthomonas axonopodis pv. cajani TaxID=487827 RepID=A0ABX3MIZ2_9XANT|nr:hypothetical protein Xcaj_22275 [Xanthomonas axonopodis pv. cajani]